MKYNQLAIVLVVFTTLLCGAFASFSEKAVMKEKDMMRKIVFDKKTPDVFYCPMQKPSSMSKIIVTARPLHKLCEYEGNPLPPEYKSDCYMDIDETDYACKEKYRIMMRKFPPGSEEPFNGARLKRFMNFDKHL
ncbi:uncharacterized protein LOC108602869 isoform X1 [Drosophila busckii]|uniref:uncharacterized protein LOC108602869 isoform X1 n=1 Tax=Drosophila busckii TaxID=30019 RepID=UPI00083F4C54|nr:uncharacterized protein LOC108602869 isoform X1 [Drosophila busckii]XP_017846659.1 uncharacterized protein LOC108602869 isoform X1 [Drosophila busckii]